MDIGNAFRDFGLEIGRLEFVTGDGDTQLKLRLKILIWDRCTMAQKGKKRPKPIFTINILQMLVFYLPKRTKTKSLFIHGINHFLFI